MKKVLDRNDVINYTSYLLTSNMKGSHIMRYDI